MSEVEKCFLCGYEKAVYDRFGPFEDDIRVRCERCNRYGMTKQFTYGFQNRMGEIGYILSGLARELMESKTVLMLNTNNAESYAKNYPVPDVTSPEEKALKFLQRLRNRTSYFGQQIVFYDIEKDYPLAYAKNSDEFISLLNLLQEKKLIEFNLAKEASRKGLFWATLKVEGWDLTNKLRTVNKESQQGFIAIWFDDSMDESIAAIEKGIEEAGYKPICIKKPFFKEAIMDKALSEIRKSRFIVVDLSEDRGSVFFEAGFAHGLGIEAIYVYNKSKNKLPAEFYVTHYQCHGYDSSERLTDLVKNAIMARIPKNPS